MYKSQTNTSCFRAEAGGSGSPIYAADSTPNLFHLYKNQETNKINIGYLLAVSSSRHIKLPNL